MIPVLREDVYQSLLVILLTFSQTEKSRERQQYKTGQVIYRKDRPVDSVINIEEINIVLWQERQLLFNMDITWWLVCSYFSWTTFLIWSEYLFLAIDISVKKWKVNSQQHWHKKLVTSKTATNVYDWFTGTLFELWPFCLLLECTHSPTQRGRRWHQERGRSKRWTCSGCRTQWRCSSPWSVLPCVIET